MTKTVTHEGENAGRNLYLVSALVRRNGVLGHRAHIGAHNSKDAAVGHVTLQLNSENYEVLSIAGSQTDIRERGEYSEIISQLRWFGEKKNWPKGLEGMSELLTGVANILQGYSLE